ncbi:Putative anti-sigma factor antagonist [Phycisphaerales bacterium]|nr:Putative anti-sigma factor antagonist [Phycisphaerales bacterium]
MDIQEQRHGAVTVVKPVGPLVQADAEQFREHLESVLTRSLGRFVIDASAVPYVDSPGLESLAAATDALIAGGRSLRVCGAGETLREVLDLTGLGERFEFFDDVTTAVRSFL